MTPGSSRSATAGPLPGGCPARGSTPAGGGAGGGAAGGPPGGAAGGCAGALPPTTWTAAWPRRGPARASIIAIPLATPVMVPLLSTFATATLFDDQIMRTVGMTLPMRSNAVASKPLRSPTRMVTEGGATWTSAMFCARAGAATRSANRARSPALVMAGEPTSC